MEETQSIFFWNSNLKHIESHRNESRGSPNICARSYARGHREENLSHKTASESADYEQQERQGGRSRGASCQQGGTLSWEHLDLLSETRSVLQERMVFTGATNLLSYLLSAGEWEARHLRSQAKRHDSERYAALPTSKLAGMKVQEVGNERYRRAVYTLMQWNEAHRP